MNNYEWKITTLRQAQGDISRQAQGDISSQAQGDVGSPDLDEWIHVALSLSKGGFEL